MNADVGRTDQSRDREGAVALFGDRSLTVAAPIGRFSLDFAGVTRAISDRE
ncbi:MAG: hypothetical protein JWP63_7204 [Candidatus Solibacter sp.]|nr:hypothetical protein [Candidatus Solibacter sp.]